VVSLTVDPLTNRISTPGFSYDAAGNVIQWPGGGHLIQWPGGTVTMRLSFSRFVRPDSIPNQGRTAASTFNCARDTVL
jgi:hypothetical protein